MAHPDKIGRGREAFAGRQWGEAYAQLTAADHDSPLKGHDLERLAAAAYLIGRDTDAVSNWTRAHHECIDRGCLDRAARWGFWLSFNFLLAGELARSTGWLARAQRLLHDHGRDCVEQGYVLVLDGLLAMGSGDVEAASAAFKQAVAFAGRFEDLDLLALGLLCRGQAFVQGHKIGEGVVLLDEAMVGVSAGEVSPILGGIIYCAVILTCERIFDLRRAREWTLELRNWCASQPDLVPFRGQCLVHRSEILQLQGDWSGALEEARYACQHLPGRSEMIVGRAFYQRGELHRLRGDFDKADRMFREASRSGYEPQPGLALLRLRQGNPDAAATAIRGVVDTAVQRHGPGGGRSRLKLLGPFVEIQLAAKEVGAARAAAEELVELAAAIGAPFLVATSAQATGAVLFAESNAKDALHHLREAWTVWQQLGIPYESARVRVLIGRIYQELGDHESARMHLEAAGAVFDQLGALPDLAELAHFAQTDSSTPAHGLTSREREVLALVAIGETNRQIAARLAISEHTVARHVSNIFDKLGVNSRTAAGAFAHANKLV